MRLASIALAVLIAAAVPAQAQYSGNLQPGQVLGNPGSTPAPARPMPLLMPITPQPGGTQQVHQNQGFPPAGSRYMWQSDYNNTAMADNFSIYSGDLSQLRHLYISSVAAGHVLRIYDSTAPGGPFTQSYTVKAGDTGQAAIIGLCKAFLNDTAWMAALLNYHPANPYTIPIGYYPIQNAGVGLYVDSGCASHSQSFGGATGGFLAFDYPEGFGNLQVQTVSGATVMDLKPPIMDGGPQPQLTRIIPGHVWGDGDLSSWIIWQANGSGSANLDSQQGSIYSQMQGPDKMRLSLQTVQHSPSNPNGVTTDRLSIGAGTAFNTAALSSWGKAGQPAGCPTPPDGAVRHCGTTSGYVDVVAPDITAGSPKNLYLPNIQGTLLTSNGASMNGNVGNPGAITNGKALGAGTVCKLTPTQSGRGHIELLGSYNNNAASGTMGVSLSYGLTSGGIPVAGGTPTGGGVGSPVYAINNANTAGTDFPFHVSAEIIMAVGTEYYFDGTAVQAGGGVTFHNVSCVASER